MKTALTLFALTLFAVAADAQCAQPQRRFVIQESSPCLPRGHCPTPVKEVVVVRHTLTYEPYSFSFVPVQQNYFALPGFNQFYPSEPVIQSAAGLPNVGTVGVSLPPINGGQTQPLAQDYANLLPAITGVALDVSTIGPAQASVPQKPTRALVENLLRARCSQCHTSPGKDNVAMFDSFGRYAPTIDKNDVYRVVVQKGKMPPGQRLPSSEVEIIKAWMALGVSDQ